MWRHNVDLLAYHDLDGRSGLKLALQEARGPVLPVRRRVLALGVVHPGGDRPRTPAAAALAARAAQHHDHPGAGGGRDDDHRAGAPAARPDNRRPDRRAAGRFPDLGRARARPAPVAGPVGQRRHRHPPELLQRRPVGLRGQQPARLRGPGPGHRRHRRPGQPQDRRHLVVSGAEQGGRRDLHHEDERRLTAGTPTRSTGYPSTAAPTS